MLIAPEIPDSETLRVPVVKVFDGDCFLTRITDPHRNMEHRAAIRLGFIDAPEIDQPGGPEAKEFLSSLISDQWLEIVLLMKMDTGGIVDRHKRIVAVPYLRQPDPLNPWNSIWRNIELEMVLNGWAWVMERYSPPDHYFAALEDAQQHRRGIWARDDNVHPWEFKKQAYQSKRQETRRSQPEPELFSKRDFACPQDGCRGHLVQRSGRFGTFYGCSEFPKCRYSCSAQQRS